MDRKSQIKKNLSVVESHYFPGAHPTLIHVTKTRPMEDILAAYELGVRDFGENRIDELKEKSEQAYELGLKEIRWHFIGNLQSNKINRLFKIQGLYAIHSVDSLKTLKSLFDRVQNLEHQVLFFVQVNTSDESEKSGLSDWDQLGALANFYSGHQESHLKWHGLMTMSKLRTDNFEKDAGKCFAQLVSIRDTLEEDYDLPHIKLSMGMSNDFKIALQLGSDYLRLGSILYK